MIQIRVYFSAGGTLKDYHHFFFHDNLKSSLQHLNGFACLRDVALQ